MQLDDIKAIQYTGQVYLTWHKGKVTHTAYKPVTQLTQRSGTVYLKNAQRLSNTYCTKVRYLKMAQKPSNTFGKKSNGIKAN